MGELIPIGIFVFGLGVSTLAGHDLASDRPLSAILLFVVGCLISEYGLCVWTNCNH